MRASVSRSSGSKPVLLATHHLAGSVPLVASMLRSRFQSTASTADMRRQIYMSRGVPARWLSTHERARVLVVHSTRRTLVARTKIALCIVLRQRRTLV